MDPHQKGPIPRMEAPIRQECPKTLHNKPTTPYQQQVQAPILSTCSAQISRGALKELMEKRSKELECQMANMGHGQGLSTKNQGAIPKKCEEAPGQNPQEQTRGRS